MDVKQKFRNSANRDVVAAGQKNVTNATEAQQVYFHKNINRIKPVGNQRSRAPCNETYDR